MIQYWKPECDARVCLTPALHRVWLARFSQQMMCVRVMSMVASGSSLSGQFS